MLAQPFVEPTQFVETGQMFLLDERKRLPFQVAPVFPNFQNPVKAKRFRSHFYPPCLYPFCPLVPQF